MTKIEVVSKILATIIIFINLYYFPFGGIWHLFVTTDPFEHIIDYLVPLAVSFYTFIVTGIWTWLKIGKISTIIFKVISTLLSLLTIYLSIKYQIWNIPVLLALILIAVLTNINLIVNKKIRTEKLLLITNAIGLGLMITFIILNQIPG